MKPRKPPFVLITVLTLCLATVAFVSVNYGKWVGTPPSMEQAQQEPIGESKQAPSKEEIAKDVSSTAARMKAGPMGIDGPEGLGGPDSQPSVYRPKPKPYRPQPNDSSIATGWYNENYGGAGSK